MTDNISVMKLIQSVSLLLGGNTRISTIKLRTYVLKRAIGINCSKHHLECDFAPSHDAISSTSLPKLPPVMIPSLQTSRENASAPSSPTTSVVVRRKSQSGSSQTSESDVEEISRRWSTASVPASMSTPSERLLDLRLMHHIMSMSSQTYFKLIGPSEEMVQRATPQTKVYTNWTVRLGLQSPCLMDALLGFAAFNLRNFDPTDTALARASHSYMTRAISAHAEEIKRGVNDRNGDVLFATASLIAFTTISSAHFMSYNEDSALPLHVRCLWPPCLYRNYIRPFRVLDLF